MTTTSTLASNTKLSINGFCWREREYNFRVKEAIKQKYQLKDVIAKAVASRYGKLEGVDDFLKPLVSKMIPDPYHLHGMEDAVKYIARMILEGKKIAIFGDYDVDGATSTALLYKYLKDIGAPEVLFHIPDRIKEGYGPNETALKSFKDAKVDLCILLDCGTVAYAPLKFAKSIGLDVIVVDHHISAETLPEAVAVINPNRYDQNSLCTNLAAVGVTFLLICGLQRYLEQEIDYFCKKSVIKRDLRLYLDLVALGTVCDIVPLTGLNRALVKMGLDVLNSSKNVGIQAMVEHLNCQKRLDVTDLGFAIGPRINAGGRVGDASIGAQLLTHSNPSQAYELAETLTALNEKRKLIEEQALKWAVKEVERKLSILSSSAKSGDPLSNISRNGSPASITSIDPRMTCPSGNINNKPSVILIAGDWHPGVSGLVASRIKDIYNLPTMAISFYKGDTVGKASCRSIAGIDIGSAILRAREKGLVIEGGGHGMAGGFSVTREEMDVLEDFFEKEFSERLNDMGFHAYKDYDEEISINQINSYFYEEMSILQPFGSGNSQMKFVIKNVSVKQARAFGLSGTHLTCRLIKDGQSIKCNAFGNAVKNQCDILINNPRNVSVFGSISMNFWNGNEYLEFLAEDVMVEG